MKIKKEAEIWDLLDENGNETGNMIQKGEPFPQGLYHLGADIWIINSENKILIQKRSPRKKLSPNVWAMTGGSVIKGETPLQTICRETFEELGVELNTENLQKMERFKTGNVWIQTYVTRQDIDLKEVKMQEEEVCDVKWATYQEIEELVENHQFIQNRWEFVKDFIGQNLKK